MSLHMEQVAFHQIIEVRSLRKRLQYSLLRFSLFENDQSSKSVRLYKRKVARLTGLEPATPGVTGRYSNQLSYNRVIGCLFIRLSPVKRSIRQICFFLSLRFQCAVWLDITTHYSNDSKTMLIGIFSETLHFSIVFFGQTPK